MAFGSDSVLLYNVEPWNKLGFGVPSFGENIGTLNRPLWGLVDEIGKIQLYLTTHVDFMRQSPPSINTIKRIGKLCNRAKSVFGGRQKETTDMRLEPGHAQPAAEIWLVHPVPYFRGPVVRNKWLMEYNDYIMIFLTNAFQHSDNNLAFTVTAKMASDLYQYINEIKLRMGYELLQIPMTTLEDSEFVFSEEHYANYRPGDVTLNLEALEQPGDIFNLPTEDDLRPLYTGIPATTIKPLLARYPIGPGDHTEDDFENTPGTGDGTAIGPAII